MGPSVKRLPCKHEDLCLIPEAHIKIPSMVVCMYVCLYVCMHVCTSVRKKIVLNLMGGIKIHKRNSSTVYIYYLKEVKIQAR